MTKEEIIDFCEMKSQLEPDNEDIYNSIVKFLEQEPCDDVVGRQAVLNLAVANHMELNGVNVVMYSPFCKDIKQLPPVTPQPKMGHWIPLGNYDDWGNESSYKCSECGDVNTWHDNFCPTCGTKMLKIYKPQSEKEET